MVARLSLCGQLAGSKCLLNFRTCSLGRQSSVSKSYQRDLGMHRRITRRDFLNGMALTVGGTLLPLRTAAGANSGPGASTEDALLAAGITERDPRYYPPVLNGMRGSHPGSFEAAHALRDGTYWKTAGTAINTGETYDLIVVGGGISGLAAAHFFRARAGKSARILVLDNHDDFGGHAKRNEFHFGGRMLLMNGGTMDIDSPTPYSTVADRLLKELGVDPPRLAAKCNDPNLYRSLGLKPAVFFDKETFGADRLVLGEVAAEGKRAASEQEWIEFLAKAPLSPAVRRDIVRIETGKVDYMNGLQSAAKKDRLWRISYKDFLLKVAQVHPDVIPFYQTRTHDEWGVGIDAEPALDCWGYGLPGFQGMGLEPGVTPHMSYTAAGYCSSGGSYKFHFPDGNASIARLLVRNLIPQAVPGRTAQDVVTARVDYGRLDDVASPVRIRLNSTVVLARHVGDPWSAAEVDVTYAREDQAYTVRGKGVVLACWNTMIPYLCPELPEKQKAALKYLVKVPLVYTTVGVRNWTSFQKLGVYDVSAPGSYWLGVRLDSVVNIGDYRSPRTPDEPALLHLSRTPCKPGLPVRDQQTAGHIELFTTSFETFERKIRDQLARTLGPGGFDPAHDIEAITVNRWPHGYGYEYNPLFDPDWPEAERPHIVGRKRFGRITIANTDSGATAYTDVAIDQAHRAISELIAAA